MKIITKIFILGFFLLYMPLAVNATTIEEVKNYVNENFKGTIPSNLGELSTIEEIENALDPYSTYFTQEEYNEYINSIASKFGLTILKEQKVLVDSGDKKRKGLDNSRDVTSEDILFKVIVMKKN